MMAKAQNPGMGYLTPKDLTWTMIDSAAGNAAIAIPADIWSNAHEFMINWRIGTNPKRSFVVANMRSAQSYVDAYWYSADFRGCCAFAIVEASAAPAASWFSIANGSDTYSINDLTWQLFWR